MLVDTAGDDSLIFEGIAPTQRWFERNGADLEIGVRGRGVARRWLVATGNLLPVANRTAFLSRSRQTHGANSALTLCVPPEFPWIAA